MNELEAKIAQVLEPIVSAKFYDLDELRIHRQGNRRIISVVMDRKTGGITLGECVQWNRDLGKLLEDENLIEGSYVVEVSSPGLDRPLKGLNAFRRSIGQKIKLKYKNSEGISSTKVFQLLDADENILQCECPESGEKISIQVESIVHARRELKN